MTYSFDASSWIHCWEHYPIKTGLFDALYKWLSEKIQNKSFVISDVAMGELEKRSKELCNWLKKYKIKVLPKNLEDINEVLGLKKQLGIQEDKYNKGVGENDLFIIAIAKHNDTVLVTEEAVQNDLPKTKANYKIPLVCKDIAKIECINFLDLLHLK